MKAHSSYFLITKVNNEFKILESKKSLHSSNDIIKHALNYSYDLMNTNDFLELNGKLFKLTFLYFNERYIFIYINPNGLDKDNNETYKIKILDIDDIDNPFRFFYSNKIIELNDNKDLVLDNDNTNIYELLDNKINYSAFAYLLDLVINNISNDICICINSDISLIPIYLNLLALSTPKNYLNKITYTYGYNKLLHDTKISFLGNNKYLKYDNTIYIDLNKSYDKELSRYVNQFITYLKSDVEDAINYKTTIESLLEKHKIDLLRAARLRNLIIGNINSFIKTKNLKMAIEDSNYEYDNKFIASSIYTNLNKFEINYDILLVYKYIYDNVLTSHDRIIELFFNNLEKFGINKNSLPYDFLNLIINNSPFDLKDYYEYLLNNNKLLETKNESFNMNYVVLEGLCRYLKFNNLTIIPNEELTKYIMDSIKEKNINNLNLILDRIHKLNKIADKRLLYYALLELEKKNPNFSNNIGLDYYIQILEKIMETDSYSFYIKLFKTTSEVDLLQALKLRVSRNSEYYEKLFKILEKNNYPEIKEKLDYKRNLDYKILSIDDLDKLYKENYLNKKIPSDGIFISKVFEYLELIDYKNKVLEAINIYNLYYKNIDDKYKDKIDSIRRLSNFIYDYPIQVLEHDLDIYNELFEIDNILYKYKRSNDNQLFELIKFGLNLKKAYQNQDFRNKFFKDLIITNNNYYNDIINEYLIRYYLKFLVLDFNKLISNPMDFENDSLLMIGYHSLFDSLTKYKEFKMYFIHSFLLIKDNEYKIALMLYMLYTLNQDNLVYNDILSKILKENKKIIPLLKEYYKVIDKIKWANNLKKDFKNYIDGYIIENTKLLKRFFWRHFKK